MDRFVGRFDKTPAVEQVLLDKDPNARVAWITLNRPEKLNALSVAMRERIIDLFEEATIDDDISVIVVRGNGRAFSSGHELNEDWNQKAAGEKRLGLSERARYSHDMCTGRPSYSQVIARCPKIVIAQVHGYCYAGAFYMLSLHADLIIASDDARIGAPQVRFLGASGSNEVKITRSLGLKAARWIAFTGIPLTASQAAEAGLVHEVVPGSRLSEVVDEQAKEIARKSAKECPCGTP